MSLDVFTIFLYFSSTMYSISKYIKGFIMMPYLKCFNAFFCLWEVVGLPVSFVSYFDPF